MKKLAFLLGGLFIVFGSFAQETKAQLVTRFDQIRNEVNPGGNTKVRIANAFQELADGMLSIYPISASGTNTYTGSLQGLDAYSGRLYFVVFANNNTGASTLNLGSMGAGNIQKYDGGWTALEADDIVANKLYRLYHDGTRFQIDLGGSGGGAGLENRDYGDITVTVDTVMTIDNGAVTNAKLAGSIDQSKITNLTSDLAGKQAALVSGTNIKTVNSTTLLGSGNLAVGDALVVNPLSQFASTTSTELAGVLSDESGSTGGFTRADYVDAKVADAINNGTTAIAPSQNATHDALGLIETSVQTDNYTLVLTDAFRTVPMNAAITKTITVPLNSSVAFSVGTVIGIKWQTGAAGQPAVAATGGVTINNTYGNLLVPAVSTTAYLKKTGTDTWTFENGISNTDIWTRSTGATLSGPNTITATGSNNVTFNYATLGANTGFLINSPSTDAASNTQTLFKVTQSGTNATTTQTTYGGYFSNVKTHGSIGTNVALYSEASAAPTNNYAFKSGGGVMLVGHASSDVITSGYQLDVHGGFRVATASNTAGLFAVSGTGLASLANSSQTFNNGVDNNLFSHGIVGTLAGTNTILHAKLISGTISASSGSGLAFYGERVLPTHNYTGTVSASNVYGFAYTPINTSLTGISNHYSFYSTSGKAYFNATNDIVGVATNNDAVAGNIGEYVSSLIAVGSAVSLTTNTSANITSITLTAGDWDVEGAVVYTEGSATVTARTGGISSTSTTLPTDGTEVENGSLTTVTTGKSSTVIPRKRFSLSAGSTTIYLIGRCVFSAGTVGGYGQITARRVR